MANCRECGVELVVDENWWLSYAKNCSYICIECQKAYNRQWREQNPDHDYEQPLIICKECGEEKPHGGQGLCNACYMRQWRKQNPDYGPPLIVCKECGEEKPHGAHGLCHTCYNRQHEPPIITCKECGEEKPHHSHGLCRTCYNRQYEAPLIICKECGEEKPHVAHGLCEACYRRQWRKDNPDKARQKTHRYRARKANATIEPVDEQAVFARYDNTCIYCGSTENLELDHVAPLNGGGPHCEDNLVVACRSCNSRKRDKPLIAWLQTQPRARAWVM